MRRSNPNFEPSRFLAPRFWPIWFFLGLLRVLAQLPWRWQLKLGAGLGDLARYLLPSRRRIIETNIAIAYPHLTRRQQRQLVKQNMRSSGMAVFETMLGWWRDEQYLNPLFQINGMEHLDSARRQGRGIILLGGHFTSMLLCGRMLATRLPLYILVKKAKNPLFEALMRRHREKYYTGVIDNHDLRAMVRALKNNRICWYAPDQDFGRKQSVFAPFMGLPTATLTITARLARLSGAAVLPISYIRLPDAKGYQITIEPPLAAYPSGDELQDATRVNQLLETLIESAPDQYLWAHRRFKTRPAGEPGLYD